MITAADASICRASCRGSCGLHLTQILIQIRHILRPAAAEIGVRVVEQILAALNTVLAQGTMLAQGMHVSWFAAFRHDSAVSFLPHAASTRKTSSSAPPSYQQTLPTLASRYGALELRTTCCFHGSIAP